MEKTIEKNTREEALQAENHKLNKSQRNALIAAIVASGTDDLNVMFLSF